MFSIVDGGVKVGESGVALTRIVLKFTIQIINVVIVTVVTTMIVTVMTLSLMEW